MKDKNIDRSGYIAITVSLEFVLFIQDLDSIFIW